MKLDSTINRCPERKNQDRRRLGDSIWRGSPVVQNRRREFIDLRLLMVVRALCGERACRRKLVFTQRKEALYAEI
jgi:hypothetical protein